MPNIIVNPPTDPDDDDVIVSVTVGCTADTERKFVLNDGAGEALVIERPGHPVVQIFGNGDVGIWDGAPGEIRYLAGPRAENTEAR